METQNTTEQQVKKDYKGVKGWLLVFCISLTILIPLQNISYYNEMNYDEIILVFNVYPSFKIFFIVDTLLNIIVLLLGITAGIKLWTLKPNAVKIAKIFLFASISHSITIVILLPVVDFPVEDMSMECIKDLLRNIIHFTVWFSYLNVSKRVKATYPTTTTPSHTIDNSSPFR